jgi:type I restriction enzyme, S subunit
MNFGGQHIIVVIPKSEIISVDFLKLAIDTLVIVRSGSAIPQLTIPMIRDYKIPFPKSLQTQQEIVAKLDALKTQTQQLESLYQTKLHNIEELKNGILKRAFEGEIK